MMKRIIKLVYIKKGMALPSVIIVSTLLLMMMVPLLNLSLQQFKISKSQAVIGSSYLASGSTTEFAIEAIKNYVKKKDYLSSYSTVVGTYVTNVKDDIFDLVNNSIGSSISVDPNNTAKSVLKNVYIIGYEDRGNKIVVTLGLVIGSTYKKGINTSTSTDVFSQVVIEIENNKNYFRPAAINTIGDIFVKDSNSIINGDVKVVGTAPEKTSQFEQYTYGGIYGVGNGNLTINGSAFVRSFIRCGNPENTSVDNFTIDIKNNAVAQCIQVFGIKDYVLVRKDGYTFDDLEMNGLDSVIAINRNFYGLSNVTGSSDEYHDASSAIVNSAVIHHPDEVSLVDAMKSKIVINGNVMINGGTFWIDPTDGTFLYSDAQQIEDASSAWNDFDEIASYKDFEPHPTPGVTTFHDPTYDNKSASSWIASQHSSGRAIGYSNLFQAFPIKTDAQVMSWFDSLKSLDFGVYPPGFIKKSTINGFCHHEMSANGDMYFMDAVNQPATGNNSDIKMADKVLSDASKVDFENSLYYLSSTERQDYISGSKNWDSFWKFGPNFIDYYNSVKTGLTSLKEPLLKITQDFVIRKYDYSGKKIDNTKQREKSTNEIFFNYIGNKMMAFNSLNDERVITGDELVPSGTNYEIGTLPDPSQYYIIVNYDPAKTLVLKGTINAIVYSRGKIIMAPGAVVNGFIMAAGQGYTRTGGLGGSAADDMPFTYYNDDIDNNLYHLNNGDFAAVSFDQGGTATVNFDFFKNPDGSIDYDKTLDHVLSQFNSETFYSTLKELFKS